MGNNRKAYANSTQETERRRLRNRRKRWRKGRMRRLFPKKAGESFNGITRTAA